MYSNRTGLIQCFFFMTTYTKIASNKMNTFLNEEHHNSLVHMKPEESRRC